MKTKIAQLCFTTALLLTLNFADDIGGPTLPPKPPTGPAYKLSDPGRDFFQSPPCILKVVTQQ
jgi:hypothetical protein